jgi:hypothetical protein
MLIFSMEAQESSPEPKPAKKYNLSVCAIFKNEKKYLKEWIEYHRRIGVDHIYLYNNNSNDRPSDILKSYIYKGYVTLTYWPDFLDEKGLKDDYIWPLSTQVSAYENAKMRAIEETEWMIFLDIDEFLIPVPPKKLADVLEQYKNAPAILLSEDFFEASHIDDLPKRHLVIETVEMTAPEINPFRQPERLIFKPALCTYFIWPPMSYCFIDDQEPIEVSRKEMRINRYVNRSKGNFQMPRRKTKLNVDMRSLSEGEILQALLEGYEIEDTEKPIHRFVPELKKALGIDPGWNW